jgi:hypothetical protein
MTRSLDGTTRVDMGGISLITHPAGLKVVLLDHAKKEARTIILPPGAVPPAAPGMPVMPGMPVAPPPPGAPAVQVVELGTRIIGGIPAVGKSFTMPAAPAAPKPPGAPVAPEMPGAPGMPAMAAAPAPIVTELWTCARTHLPVLTKVSGDFGTQITACKVAPTADPHPATFQIPPGYKLT